MASRAIFAVSRDATSCSFAGCWWPWLLVALIVDQGQGTLKGLSRHLPSRLRYGALMRMVRSGQWDAQELLSEVVTQVLPWLPAPADGVLYLLADSTLKQKRGQKQPLARKARMNE